MHEIYRLQLRCKSDFHNIAAQCELSDFSLIRIRSCTVLLSKTNLSLRTFQHDESTLFFPTRSGSPKPTEARQHNGYTNIAFHVKIPRGDALKLQQKKKKRNISRATHIEPCDPTASLFKPIWVRAHESQNGINETALWKCHAEFSKREFSFRFTRKNSRTNCKSAKATTVYSWICFQRWEK